MVDLKIATVQPIGVLDETTLEPANMSSGSASAGQVLTADGAGGADWSTEAGLGDVTGPASATDGRITVFNGTTGKAIKEPTAAVDMNGQDISNVGSVAGHVPTTRNISNGTGISGGGDLSADRTLSVNQSALDPANMSSGSATSGQLLTAGGGGATSWADAPASGIAGPVSSTDTALTRWNGVNGDTVQDSVVTLSGAGAMAFPAAGSISKPGAGAGSEAFGATAAAAGSNAVALGPAASASGTGSLAIGSASKVYNVSSGDSNGSIALGSGAVVGNATPGAGCNAAVCIGEAAEVKAGATDGIAIGPDTEVNPADAIALGRGALVRSTSSLDSIGAIAIGRQAIIGNGTAGCNASICIGESGLVSSGATSSVAIGEDVNIGLSATNATAIGANTDISGNSTECTVLGANATVTAGADRAVVLGHGATVDQGNSTAVGEGSSVLGSGGIALGQGASVADNHLSAVAIGRNATTTASSRVTFASALEVEIGQGLAVWGATPPASQPAKINDITATAGASYTATEQGMLNDLKARVNSIIDVLEGAGLSSAT